MVWRQHLQGARVPDCRSLREAIKITYTQVLPLQREPLSHRYALQSELLQQTPLRDLSIDVKVNSAAPLKSVTLADASDARRADRAFGRTSNSALRNTRRRATSRWSSEPKAGRRTCDDPAPRGDDGYFMLQLHAAGTDGDWDRPLLPNGDPFDLLILADTSASIDAGQRQTQATFTAPCCQRCTPKDTFNLATCDVTCDWAFAKALAADARTSRPPRCSRQSLSLGWTNLDGASPPRSAMRAEDARNLRRRRHRHHRGCRPVASANGSGVCIKRTAPPSTRSPSAEL